MLERFAYKRFVGGKQSESYLLGVTPSGCLDYVSYALFSAIRHDSKGKFCWARKLVTVLQMRLNCELCVRLTKLRRPIVSIGTFHYTPVDQGLFID